MLIINSDLINSCRVCRSPNQEGDYQCLYQSSSKHNTMLTDAGILYENLLEISLIQRDCYPQFLCNSCDLQMKLFKKLKDKAYKTLEYLQNLYDEDMRSSKENPQPVMFEEYNSLQSEQQIDEDVEECQRNIDTCQQNEVLQEYETNAFNANIEELEENAFRLPNLREITETKYLENEGDVTAVEKVIPYISTKKTQSEREYENTEKVTDIPQEAEVKIDYLANKLILKVKSNEEITHDTELKLEQVIDKNDYVTEIYELLDTYSDNNENVEYDVLTEAKMEICSAFSDIEYVLEDKIDEMQDDGNEQDFQSVYEPEKRLNDSERNAKSTRKREHKCTPCLMEFKNAREHKAHRTEAHNDKYPCNVCFKELKTMAALHHHMIMHNDQPAFQCEICQKTFNQKAHYQYHMNRHNNVRNFKCTVCDKTFLSKADLKVHMRCHTGQRPYVCSICGKDYLMMEHLKTHFLTHTDQYFQCVICNNKFTTHKTLRLHVKTIHEDEPKFKCTFCMKPFRRKHHLEYHLKLHQRNLTSLDSGSEKADDPGIVTNEMDEYNPDDLDEEYSVDDPGFIALNDDVI